MAEGQGTARGGVRDRRLHGALGLAQIFWCSTTRWISWPGTALRRQSGNRIYATGPGRALQEVSTAGAVEAFAGRSAARKARHLRCTAARGPDRLPGMDRRGEASPTGISGFARRQRSPRVCAPRELAAALTSPINTLIIDNC